MAGYYGKNYEKDEDALVESSQEATNSYDYSQDQNQTAEPNPFEADDSYDDEEENKKDEKTAEEVAQPEAPQNEAERTAAAQAQNANLYEAIGQGNQTDDVSSWGKQSGLNDESIAELREFLSYSPEQQQKIVTFAQDKGMNDFLNNLGNWYQHTSTPAQSQEQTTPQQTLMNSSASVTPTDPNGIYDPTKKYGKNDNGTYSYSYSAAQLQNELAKRGYYKGSVDGYFGDQTQDALNHYLADNGIIMRRIGAVTDSATDAGKAREEQSNLRAAIGGSQTQTPQSAPQSSPQSANPTTTTGQPQQSTTANSGGRFSDWMSKAGNAVDTATAWASDKGNQLLNYLGSYGKDNNAYASPNSSGQASTPQTAATGESRYAEISSAPLSGNGPRYAEISSNPLPGNRSNTDTNLSYYTTEENAKAYEEMYGHPPTGLTREELWQAVSQNLGRVNGDASRNHTDSDVRKYQLTVDKMADEADYYKDKYGLDYQPTVIDDLKAYLNYLNNVYEVNSAGEDISSIPFVAPSKVQQEQQATQSETTTPNYLSADDYISLGINPDTGKGQMDDRDAYSPYANYNTGKNEPYKASFTPLPYDAALMDQEKQKDSWSPNWTNDTRFNSPTDEERLALYGDMEERYRGSISNPRSHENVPMSQAGSMSAALASANAPTPSEQQLALYDELEQMYRDSFVGKDEMSNPDTIASDDIQSSDSTRGTPLTAEERYTRIPETETGYNTPYATSPSGTRSLGGRPAGIERPTQSVDDIAMQQQLMELQNEWNSQNADKEEKYMTRFNNEINALRQQYPEASFNQLYDYLNLFYQQNGGSGSDYYRWFNSYL